MHFMAETIAKLNYIQFVKWYSCRKRVRLYQMGHNIQVFCWIFIKYQCNITKTVDRMTAFCFTYFLANRICHAFRKYSWGLFHSSSVRIFHYDCHSHGEFVRLPLESYCPCEKNQFDAYSIKFNTKIFVDSVKH